MACWWDKYKCEDCGFICDGDELQTVVEKYEAWGHTVTEKFIQCPKCGGDVAIYKGDDEDNDDV